MGAFPLLPGFIALLDCCSLGRAGLRTLGLDYAEYPNEESARERPDPAAATATSIPASVAPAPSGGGKDGVIPFRFCGQVCDASFWLSCRCFRSRTVFTKSQKTRHLPLLLCFSVPTPVRDPNSDRKPVLQRMWDRGAGGGYGRGSESAWLQ